MAIRNVLLAVVLFFAAIVSPVQAQTKSDEFCLALTAFTEARAEGDYGMALVMHTVLNRTKSRNKTVCQVAYAKGQFHGVLMWPSGTDPGRHSPLAWREALGVARKVLAGAYNFGACKGAEYFYAPKTYTPTWSRRLPFKCQYGGHRFHGA